ncbi:dipeptide ABC transporter ATP-binding protein [Aureimonas populi]|uniref:Dipeptide ABC transporter ATP-binding protein n=1 Tax=Aureimonas populi TaxID=1701758 RepID=A0ABW5CSN8_9HYPH|nr:ABC transporter ATP-binding protein [Aureimonas populi]
MSAALAIEGLRVEYPVPDAEPFVAVRDLDLRIEPGEIHALVGESGAGKSTVGNCVMGLLDRPGRIVAGSLSIAGRPVDTRTGRAEGIRPGRDIGAIFQDPMTSLNPLFTIEEQLCETMRHHLGFSRAQARTKALDLLRAVKIPEPERRLRQYPHQLSGGQRQRVVIAAALSCDPGLLVADEPTTALDVSVQATILELLRDLATRRHVGVLLVTHNMGVVAQIADRVTVMRHGEVVEQGPTREILGAPKAPYARALIAAVPRLDRKLDRFPVTDPQNPGEAEAQARLGTIAAHRGEGELLAVEKLSVVYGGGLFNRTAGYRAVDDVSFSVKRGEIFGIVGESGSGKSTLAAAIAGLATPTSGRIAFDGRELAARRPRAVRQAIQMIFQDPYSSLNARMRVGAAIQEPIAFFGTGDASGARTLIEAVGLPPESARRFPHAFSGGQRQRISIARALASRPELLICDEPTSALDVSVQARVLNLLKDLRDRTGLTILFISHDLAVVRQMCDRIAVMKAGRIVELEACETLFDQPRDPYTRELLSLIPSLDGLAPASPPAIATGA